MSEVSRACQKTCDTLLITECERFVVAFGPSRLDDATYTGIDEYFRPIWEGKECIRSSNGVARLAHGSLGF